ncbi:hypothetical protein ACFXHA_34935 [Nocardia sp. NPDC059240]|uniref:hypothetical protein n=1 Tax=Nocardia sp. NPDC059240 TaxID=3346786 RepID=UPI00367BE4F8
MNDFENMTPDEVAALTQRLILDPAQAEEMIPDPGADSGDTIVPRSIKLPASLDRRCKARATELGMNQSAYIRSLIEKDLAGPQARPLTTADLPLILEFIRHAA